MEWGRYQAIFVFATFALVLAVFSLLAEGERGTVVASVRATYEPYATQVVVLQTRVALAKTPVSSCIYGTSYRPCYP